MRVADRIDLLLALVKWPVAIAGLLAVPGLLAGAWAVLKAIAADPTPVLLLAAGAALYLVLWHRWLRYSRTSWLLTLEHELTHALFAVLTFHKVIELKVTMRRGGYVRYLGRGNWLISLAPYFFPTAPLVCALVGAFLPAEWLRAAAVVLGASFAYHVTSTLRETHPGQSDLAQAGHLFSLLFLPVANLATLGSLLAVAHGGTAGLSLFWEVCWSRMFG